MKFVERFLREVKGGPWQIIMIGGPGSGKSTYSKYITKHFDIPHIYTGDMMRDLSKKDTPDGRRVKRLLPSLIVFVILMSFAICLFNPTPRESIFTGLSSLFGLSNIYLIMHD